MKNHTTGRRRALPCALALLIAPWLAASATAGFREEVTFEDLWVRRVCDKALGRPRVSGMLARAQVRYTRELAAAVGRGEDAEGIRARALEEARDELVAALAPVVRGEVRPGSRTWFNQPVAPKHRQMERRVLDLDRRGLVRTVLSGFQSYGPGDRAKIRSVADLMDRQEYYLFFAGAGLDAQYELTRLWVVPVYAALRDGSLEPHRPEEDWSLSAVALEIAVERARARLAALYAARGVEIPAVLDGLLLVPLNDPATPPPPPEDSPLAGTGGGISVEGAAALDPGPPTGGASGLLGQAD